VRLGEVGRVRRLGRSRRRKPAGESCRRAFIDARPDAGNRSLIRRIEVKLAVSRLELGKHVNRCFKTLP
jgi:hypothetical protein